MRPRLLTKVLFWAGVFLLFVHTTFPALWELAGFTTTYPLGSSEGFLGVAAGFTPPLGAAMMLASGIVEGRRSNDGGDR